MFTKRNPSQEVEKEGRGPKDFVTAETSPLVYLAVRSNNRSLQPTSALFTIVNHERGSHNARRSPVHLGS
jgi:hypothetical protein